jgi:hypothetical protein
MNTIEMLESLACSTRYSVDKSTLVRAQGVAVQRAFSNNSSTELRAVIAGNSQFADDMAVINP